MAYNSSKTSVQNNRYVGLTKEEEHDLIRKHQDGDQRATLKLLTQFDSFLRKLTWGFVKKNPILTFDDSLQAAKIGFLEALNKFDFSYDGRLSTYAQWWAKAKIQDAKRDAAPERWISRNNTSSPVMKAMQETRNLSGVDLEKAFQKAAQDTGEDIEYIRMIREKMFLTELSLNAEIGHEGSTTTWVDMLESPYAHPMEAIQYESTKKALHKAINDLDPRQKAILTARFGLHGEREQTLEEISNVYGLTKERIRQIEVMALAKLSKKLKSQHLISKEDIPAMTGDLSWGEPQPY